MASFGTRMTAMTIAAQQIGERFTCTRAQRCKVRCPRGQLTARSLQAVGVGEAQGTVPRKSTLRGKEGSGN